MARLSRSAGARTIAAAGCALALSLAGCSGADDAPEDANALDNALVGNAKDADPAMTGALADQIMVDPSLSQQAGGTSAKPAETPIQAPIPPDMILSKGPAGTQQGLLRVPPPAATSAAANPTLGEIAKLQASSQQGRANAKCLQGLKYGMSWAARLPADIPLYPQAQVSEAAGNEDGGCGIRVVSFASGAELQQMLDWYYTRAVRSGYSAEHQASGGEHILAGTKGANAYYLMARKRNSGGSEVDLVISHNG